MTGEWRKLRSEKRFRRSGTCYRSGWIGSTSDLRIRPERDTVLVLTFHLNPSLSYSNVGHSYSTPPQHTRGSYRVKGIREDIELGYWDLQSGILLIPEEEWDEENNKIPVANVSHWSQSELKQELTVNRWMVNSWLCFPRTEPTVYLNHSPVHAQGQSIKGWMRRRWIGIKLK